MTPEIGHYAVALAFIFSVAQGAIPLWGAYKNNPAVDELCRANRPVPIHFRSSRVCLSDYIIRRVRLLCRAGCAKFSYVETPDLQNFWGLG